MNEREIRGRYMELYAFNSQDPLLRQELQILAQEARRAKLPVWRAIIDARLARCDGDDNTAMTHVDAALKQEPENLIALVLKASVLPNERSTESVSLCESVCQQLAEANEVGDLQLLGLAMINKGIALGQMEKPGAAVAVYDEVITRFGEAMELPLREQVASAMVNKGIALGQMEKHQAAVAVYDEAITRFGEAIEPSLRARVANAMVNKGIEISAQGDHARAIQLFDRALAAGLEDSWVPDTWLWKGNAWSRHGKTTEAVAAWTKAAELASARADSEVVSLAQRKIAAASKGKKEQTAKDRTALQQTTPLPGAEESAEQRILRKLEKVERTKYEEYGRKFGLAKCEEEVLAVLRGWGSAVGLLPSDKGNSCRGGGYLLKWKGKGLLIDPGYDCLRNLHDAGFHCREINAVLVSHNHTDHNDDLRSFDDIRYEMHERAKEDQERQDWEYMLLWDTDTAQQRRFEPEAAAHRHQKIMEIVSRKMGRMEHKLDGLPFRVKWFRVNHGQDVHNAVGFRIECLNEKDEVALTVGFTCDTEYFKELCDSDHLGNCDILIAHMSMPDPQEYTDPRFEKERHLGYRGTEKLIKGAEPKLALVGEFWAGITDLRVDLVDGLRALCKTDAIIPASIGLQIKPSNRQVRCTKCSEWTSLSEVGISSSATEFGPLGYHCRHCRL